MVGEILVVEDDGDLRAILGETLELAGFNARTVATGPDAISSMNDARPDLVVSDIHMKPWDGLELLAKIREGFPDIPVLLMTAFGSIPQAVTAMQRGATDYLVKPFDAEVLAAKVSEHLTSSDKRDVADVGGVSSDAEHAMVIESPASKALAEMALKVADRDVSVLISGESGTGKEVLAHFIHRHSNYADGPFVAINCAAIPENMLEAMLFGYEKGAYTGAHKACAGKFEQANGGTILLDEITEMAMELQAKLLRVLQENEVERLGAKEPTSLDVRVIATTNRDLQASVRAGAFREDLFYRLNVFPLTIAPLRDRSEDILPIAHHLLRKHASAPEPVISDPARLKLLQHTWPGNVRELGNVIQRALVLANESVIDAEDLILDPVTYQERSVQPGGSPQLDEHDDTASSLSAQVQANENRRILDALTAFNGNRSKVADHLQISPRTLRYKLAKIKASGVELP